MPTLTGVSVDEYLRTSYEPDREYVDGQLVERNVGEHFHSRLQHLISMVLGPRERERRFRVFPEQRVRVSDAPRFRIPDICVKALPYHVTPVLVQPDLVIEVMSPDDRTAEMLEKIGDYVQAGIPYIWVADPYQRKLVTAEHGIIQPGGTLVVETPLVGRVDFANLFQQLDEPAE
jgi:Uma2 family endonuclease